MASHTHEEGVLQPGHIDLEISSNDESDIEISSLDPSADNWGVEFEDENHWGYQSISFPMRSLALSLKWGQCHGTTCDDKNLIFVYEKGRAITQVRGDDIFCFAQFLGTLY